MGADPAIRVLTAERWAVDVADRWVGLLRRRPALRMCLATGATPLPLYIEISRRDVSWDEADVLLLDEWIGLPPDEPGRCDAVLRRSLLDHVDLPAGSYRPIEADAADLAAECSAVDTWLDGGLDLAVLGLGGNGHLGMNEPGTQPGRRTHRAALAPATVEASAAYFGDRARPSHGVTVGLGDLLAAAEVWVLVTGSRKSQIVRDCLFGPVGPDVPGSLLREHPNCTWWLDTAAGRHLPRP